MELQSIPGVGPKTADDLILIGINSIADLKTSDLEALYEKFCLTKGHHVDQTYHIYKFCICV